MNKQPVTPADTIKSLEQALAHARALADAERRRAERAEASARRAWQLATWAAPTRRAAGQTHAEG